MGEIQVPPPPHVHFNKQGRAYADMDSLIDTELARVSTETNYLTADEARNLCPPDSTEQVFGDIRSKARVGGRDLVMRTALLLSETRKQLLDLGYTVRDGAGTDGDLTVIEW